MNVAWFSWRLANILSHKSNYLTLVVLRLTMEEDIPWDIHQELLLLFNNLLWQKHHDLGVAFVRDWSTDQYYDLLLSQYLLFFCYRRRIVHPRFLIGKLSDNHKDIIHFPAIWTVTKGFDLLPSTVKNQRANVDLSLTFQTWLKD